MVNLLVAICPTLVLSSLKGRLQTPKGSLYFMHVCIREGEPCSKRFDFNDKDLGQTAAHVLGPLFTPYTAKDCECRFLCIKRPLQSLATRQVQTCQPLFTMTSIS